MSEMEAYYRQSRSSPGDFYSQLMALKAEQEEHIALVEGVYLRELAGSRAGEAAGKRGILKGMEGHNKQVQVVFVCWPFRLKQVATSKYSSLYHNICPEGISYQSHYFFFFHSFLYYKI